MSYWSERMKNKAIRIYACAVALEKAERAASEYEEQLTRIAADNQAIREQNVRLLEGVSTQKTLS